MAQHFKDSVVWQKAMDLVTEVYKLTDSFPKREVYSLADQIRRAAVSVPSNIAEGQAHYSHRDFASCAIPRGPLLNSKHSCFWPSVSDIRNPVQRKTCSSESTK
jgi:hypothetical protein